MANSASQTTAAGTGRRREKGIVNGVGDLCGHDASYYFSLARWAKEKGVLRSWERRLLYSVGTYIGRGWRVSEKQERQTLRILETAIRIGFCEAPASDAASTTMEVGRRGTSQMGNTGVKTPQEWSDGVGEMEGHAGATPEPGKGLVERSLLAELEAKGIRLDRKDVGLLALTPTVSTRLREGGIHTIEQLSRCSEALLVGMDYIGHGKVESIKRKVSSYLGQMMGKSELMVDRSLLLDLEANGVPLNSISVGVLRLTPGVVRNLKRANIHTVKQLGQCTEADLVGVYEVGSTRIGEINTALSFFLQDMRQSIAEAGLIWEDLFRVVSQLCSRFEEHGLLSELPLPQGVWGGLGGDLGKRLETLADLKGLVRLRMSSAGLLGLDVRTAGRVRALEQVLRWLREAQRCGSVDDEINALIGGLTDRERFVLTSRFGMEKHLVLEEIAGQFEVSRERVRQMETKAQKKIAERLRNRPPLFYSESAIALLKRLGEDATVALWKQELMNVGFLKDASSLDLLVAVGRVTEDARLALPQELDRLLETGVSPRILSLKGSVLKRARKVVRWCGAVRAISLVNQRLSQADVEGILSLGGFTEVHSGWWVRGDDKCVAARVARKVVAQCGPVSPLDLRRALQKHLGRFQLPAPPSEVLVKLLEQTGDFALADGLLCLTRPPVVKPRLRGTESAFTKMVRSDGPVVSFESMEAELLKAGWSAASVNALTSFSPIVARVGSGLYTLTGARYDAADIERVKSRVTRVAANPMMRPRSDGVVEYEINVGMWMVHGGVLSCSRALSLDGAWTVMVDGIRRGELVVGGGFVRGVGLSEAGRLLSLSLGDRIRMEFNTWTREVGIRKVVNDAEKA